MLPWLLNGFGTQVKVSTLDFSFAIRDAPFEQGSDYYNEVECSAEGKGSAQVCWNTKYVKKNVSAGAKAAPQPSTRTAAADPVQLADGRASDSDEEKLPPSTFDDSDGFYEEDGEL